MRFLFPLFLVGLLLLAPNVGWTQTAEIQKKVDDDLKQEKAKAAALEQLIAEALKSNPDIRVAEARVNEVAAELDRVRMKTTADVAALHADIIAADAGVQEGNDRHQRALKLKQAGALSQEEYQSTKLLAMKLQAELAAIEKKMPYLLGRQNAAEKDTAKAASPEPLIVEAMKNNPDIRVAEAKLREIAAHLDRTRLRVAADVTILHAEIEAAKASVDEGLQRYLRAYKLWKKGQPVEEEFGTAKMTLLKLKAELASVQAKLPYLLGRQAGVADINNKKQIDADRAAINSARAKEVKRQMDEDIARLWAEQLLVVKTESPQRKKLRNALDTETKYPPQLNGKTLADIAGVIRDEEGLGINIVIRVKSKKIEKVNIQLEKPIPLGAFLQYLEDELDVVFILRDYGIVVVAADEKLPPGALRVVDFWKHGKAVESKVETKEKK
jgi:hypothetical protein